MNKILTREEFTLTVQSLLKVETTCIHDFFVDYHDELLDCREDLLLYQESGAEWTLRFNYWAEYVSFAISFSFGEYVGTRPGINFGSLVNFCRVNNSRRRTRKNAARIATKIRKYLSNPWDRLVKRLHNTDRLYFYDIEDILVLAGRRIQTTEHKTAFLEMFMEVVKACPENTDVSNIGYMHARRLGLTRKNLQASQSNIRKNLAATEILVR